MTQCSEIDIVDRLRLRADALRSEGQAMRAQLEDQAADEIDRLRAALDTARSNARDTFDAMKGAEAMSDYVPVLKNGLWTAVPRDQACNCAPEIARLHAALFDLKAQLRTSAAAAYKARLDANAAEAELDAARAKALEDAAVKVESLWAYRTCAEVATAIRAMKEPKK